MNTSSTTNLLPPPIPVIRIAGASITTFLAVSSLSVNLLLILALRKFKPGDCVAFYLINWQLLVGDVVNLCFCQLLLIIPITMTGQAIYGHGFLLRLLGALDTFSYSSTLFFSALMTLNRVTVFLSPKLNNLLFKRPRIIWSIASIWLYSALIALALDLGGCPKLYSEEGLFLSFVCTSDDVPSIIWALRQYYRFVPSILPALMLLTYLALFFFLKWHDPMVRLRNAGVVNAEQAKQRAKRERSLLFQSFLICGMLEVEDVAFNVLLGNPMMSQGQWPYIVNICSNWIILLLNSMTALILFTFNAQIRMLVLNSLSCIFKCQWPQDDAMPQPNNNAQSTPFPSSMLRTLHACVKPMNSVQNPKATSAPTVICNSSCEKDKRRRPFPMNSTANLHQSNASNQRI